jgi:clostripain
MTIVVGLTACGDDDKYVPGDKTWTIMYYGDADCDLEEYLMEDIAEMKAGFVNGYGVNLIILIDRYDGYSNDSSVLGDNFTDTRLYRITQGDYERLDGDTQFPDISADGSSSYEANMGDAATLKKFIQYCKEKYPATDYALIFSNHGGGVKKKSASVSGEVFVSDSNPDIIKNICYDESSGDDFLYTGEISDTLTSDDSVQLLGLDACFMSSVEFAYQFRNDNSNSGFKAEIMVASAPSLWGFGWDYASICGNLHRKSVDPTYMDASTFGRLIVETQKVSTRNYSSQSLTCIDLSKVQAVKEAVDDLAVSLAPEKNTLETLRGDAPTASLLNYFTETLASEWASYPYFDLYNLATAVYASSSFSSSIQNDASILSNAVDSMVLYSFGNSAYSGFVEGKSGVHIFFPDGDYVVTVNTTSGNVTDRCWRFQWWYNSRDLTSNGGYGKLAWCKNGATASNTTIENWFELLDSWFDTANDSSSNNLNGYIY